MFTLLSIVLIVVAAMYGANVGSDRRDTKWCIAVTCNMESYDSGGTTGVQVRHQPTENHQTQE
jgi:hypothetical protein